MKRLENQVCLVVDHGLYLHVAIKLAETFKDVRYFAPWSSDGFPKADRRRIGTGIPGVNRVYSLWANVPDADLIVCPDVYLRDEVLYLRSLGKPVWGAGNAEALELERWGTKKLMDSLDMPVIDGDLVKGITNLREYLEDKDDAWIKSASAHRGPGRGDIETWHWEGAGVSAPQLERLAEQLGQFRDEAEFIVEQPVPGCEVGYDGFCVDGEFSKTALYGFEVKDAGYVGRVCDFNDLPDPVLGPTIQLAPAMGRLGCRGFYSNEVRISENGDPYLIDPCLRCGSPPSEAYIELFSNWPEVIAEGARGRVVDLDPESAFVAEIVLKSEWVTDRHLPVSFPEEIGRFIKLHNSCQVDGKWYVMKQAFPEFGAAIGLGNTQKAAERAAIEHAEAVKALDLEWKKSVFDEARECIAKGKKVGVEWPD